MKRNWAWALWGWNTAGVRRWGFWEWAGVWLLVATDPRKGGPTGARRPYPTPGVLTPAEELAAAHEVFAHNVERIMAEHQGYPRTTPQLWAPSRWER